MLLTRVGEKKLSRPIKYTLYVNSANAVSFLLILMHVIHYRKPPLLNLLKCMCESPFKNHTNSGSLPGVGQQPITKSPPLSSL